MSRTLNIANIRTAMEQAGLSQAALAKKLDVSREITSKWLSGAKYPRPDKLLRISSALQLDLDDLVTRAPDPNEPVIAFRKKGRATTTAKHIARAKNMGRLLSGLVPYLPFDEFIQPPRLKNPRLDYEYIQSFAASIRQATKLNLDQVIDFVDLIGMFHGLQAVIIPVLWGRKDVHENALHIYLPDSMTTWIYLNLDTEAHDFKFWMAHELGHVFSPDLRGEPAEDFADAFAGALLFPGKLAEQAYNDILSIRSDRNRISKIKEYALEYSISLISVYVEINNYAVSAGRPEIEMGDSLFGANANFNKRFKTISGSLFDGKNPGPADYINVAREAFKTSFFDVLEKYLVEHRNSMGFIQSILDIPLIDAKELYAELS